MGGFALKVRFDFSEVVLSSSQLDIIHANSIQLMLKFEMQIVVGLTLLLLGAPLSGCLSSEDDSGCNEDEYWNDISEDSPYPGLDCDSGPSKTLALTIFVYRDTDGVEWLSNESSIDAGIELINSIYNPSGIEFVLGEIVWIDQAFPDVQDSEGGSTETLENKTEDGADFGDQVSIAQLGDAFTENYDPSTLNMVMTSNGWGSFSMYPWWSREYYVTTVRASTFATSPIPGHEIGHFLGLYHTHQFYEDPESDSDLEQATVWTQNWVEPTDQCYRTGDFICGTPYDCYIWCEEVIGCTANAYESDRPNQTPSEYQNCTVEQHDPSRTNLMSRYGDRSEITLDQGARARYFIQFMTENEREGNLLVLVEE